MLGNAYDYAQCTVKFCTFYMVVYFSTVKYLNTSGQYLNTDTVFGI